MKIDPKIPANGELQSGSVKNTAVNTAQTQTRPAGVTATQSEDTFQASGRHAEVQRLTAQANAVPDVRTDKVAPLQAKVQNGTYKPDSQKVADALLSEHGSNSAKG